MTQTELAKLDDFKTHFLETPLQPVKCADLASVIQIITKLFDQADWELTHLEECADSLAAHTGYQLKEYS